MHKDNMGALLQSMDLTDRVNYVRGDPSRELRLEYPNNTFDMVRLSYCSLNLAETEWYVFLQEVNRVLKPGGVLEVIEEDLLFPGHKPPDAEDALHIQRCHPSSDLTPLTPLSAVYDSRSMLPRIRYTVDPLDHSKLTRAWHEMLTSRWISASITSVLPFYLSAIFETFRALPALEILMGPSSTLRPFPSKRASHQQMIDPEPFRHLAHATVKDDADAPVKWMPASEAPSHFIPSNASMHLARMVAIVNSCKEAIWGAYNKLYGNDPRLPRRVCTPCAKNSSLTGLIGSGEWFFFFSILALHQTDRDIVDSDMRSRIDMRSTTKTLLQWCGTDTYRGRFFWLHTLSTGET
ncbi:hypothetical protein B0F90DRAFT_1709133 [Multifurca ochricompacta]|uniref:Methyltransferase type 11 domain-containing protein n=1 Tax=Multifurca ochricompacta TaxID=376703 RepID=A0AAD4M916_9AGAM|nr:hypothetical protein B0F90DRAFT_1709133 [Multifurca ochricompacta]